MTIKPLKGRSLKEGQRVFVYFNLHKKCYSIRDHKTGLVVAHADSLNLYNVTWKVGQAGRKKVLETGTKNVHAGLLGNFTERKMIVSNSTKEATYNPFKYDSFVDRHSEQPLDESWNVGLAEGTMYYR